MRIDDILDRLDRLQRAGDGYLAACPAHDDRVRSLSIGVGENDRVLLHCHAGCTFYDVIETLGLRATDLFSEDDDRPYEQPRTLRRIRVPNAPRPNPARPVTVPTITPGHIDGWAEWLQAEQPILDRLHELKGWSPLTLIRLGIGWDGRRLTFPVRAPGGQITGVLRYLPGGDPKMRASRGAGRDLWPCPESFPQDCILWLVEGEPDAISLAELGYFAVAVPGAGRWLDDWTRRLLGHMVVVVADCDKPGREHARRAFDALHKHVEVRPIDLDPARWDGHDVGDELASAVPQGDLGKHRVRRSLEAAAGLRERRAA